mgnify:FL=1|jgi:3-oxoacyl-[acyl-carrier-protein] synthase-3|tara:strand:+ start:2400 stop:3335 length:936 start_codon:yes stop_codon:yes gene_type:complete
MHDLSYAMGSIKRTVDESAKTDTFSSVKLLRSSGFENHYIADENESVLDLAIKAVEPIRDRLKNLDSIIWASCIPENATVGNRESFEKSKDVKPLMDYPASRLQSHLGMPQAIVLGLVQQACTSMLGSIRVACGLLATEIDFNNILCITSDRFPLGAKYEQAYSLISDGAACCIVSREQKGFRILASHHITNGSAVQANDEETAAVYFTYMNRIVNEILEKVKITIDDLDWIIPQNINQKAWQILSRILKIDLDRVFAEPMSEVAHCISGDNIINLKHLNDSQRIKPGQRLLCLMAGYGLNWQALLLEKVN